MKNENTIYSETVLPNTKKGVSGSTLKLIAIFSMLIDHIGAILLPDFLIMRLIGRISFPIFCFLLVEGFLHTRDIKKYAIRLFTFCIISEVPFDLAFFNTVLYTEYQNVFFTLFIGALVLITLQSLEKWAVISKQNRGEKPLFFAVAIRKVFFILLGCITASLLKTDYSAFGILFIVLLYSCRKNKKLQIIFASFATIWEVTAPLAFIPIFFYNGKRGLSLKYVFYLFYPIHLLVLYGIAAFL